MNTLSSAPVSADQLTAFLAKLAPLIGRMNGEVSTFTVTVETGRKYSRIIRETRSTRTGAVVSRSAYGFVNMQTGDVLKAASWKAPVQGARGNIHGENALTGCGEIAVEYRYR